MIYLLAVAFILTIAFIFDFRSNNYSKKPTELNARTRYEFTALLEKKLKDGNDLMI